MEEVKGSNPFRSTNILFIDIRAMNGDRESKVEPNNPLRLELRPVHPCSRIVRNPDRVGMSASPDQGIDQVLTVSPHQPP